MVYFPDKRDRYKGIAPWNIPAGNPHADNKTKVESKSERATRAPLGAFRVSTTEDPALLQQQAEAEALKAREAENQKGISEPSSSTVPDMESFNLDDPRGNNHFSSLSENNPDFFISSLDKTVIRGSDDL
jgi:hypothetical protein